MKCDFSTHNFTESMFTLEKANFFRISFFRRKLQKRQNRAFRTC